MDGAFSHHSSLFYHFLGDIPLYFIKKLYHWENVVNGTSSEIDYIIVRNIKVMPIGVRSKTLPSWKI